MNTYLVVFLFLFSLLELSCKSRSGRLESENPIPTKTVTAQDMKDFKLGQDIIQNKVPKIQAKFKDYKPSPILKIKTENEAANQAFSEKTEGENILRDVNEDRKYFSSLLNQNSEMNTHIQTLEFTRKSYMNEYKDITSQSKLPQMKLFKPETSIKSDSFFDFFMGILDAKHKEPLDNITFSEGYQNNNILKTFFSALVNCLPKKISDYFEVMKGNVKNDNDIHFLYLEKATLDENKQWFENKESPQVQIYIPFLGKNEDDYKSLVVENEKDLSNWLKKAAKEIGVTNPTQTEIKINDYPVYYLDSDGKLKPLTKAALETF